MQAKISLKISSFIKACIMLDLGFCTYLKGLDVYTCNRYHLTRITAKKYSWFAFGVRQPIRLCYYIYSSKLDCKRVSIYIQDSFTLYNTNHESISNIYIAGR